MRTSASISVAVLATISGQALGIDQNGPQNQGPPKIQWQAPGAPAISFDRTPQALSGTLGEHIVVQLAKPLTQSSRDSLAKSGLRLLAPLGSNAFFAAVDGNVAPANILRSALLAGAAPIRPEWKIDQNFLAPGQTPDWIIVERRQDPLVAVYVQLHDDVPVAVNAQQVVARRGGNVIGTLVSVNVAEVHIPRSALHLLATEDEVQWIEPVQPLLEPVNAENRALTGVNTVNAAPYNLSGAGVKVFVFDGGSIRTTHVDLAGRVTVLDGSAAASHATHCAGTIGGTGTGVANNRGMAPGVTFLSAAVSTATSGWLYSAVTDLETDYANAYTQGAHLSSNSIGTNTANNGFDCKWEGDYHTVAGVIDSIVRGSSTVTSNNPFRVVWAAGNERGASRCGLNYRTIGSPATAKNHLCIGSVDADSDNISSFSGWGPTDDGRMKPDFAAPGCQSGGDGGVTSCTNTSNTSYGAMCGTSMATPTVAGIVSLILQDYRAQFPATPDPRNSTLKALLAQSATDRGNAGPDYQYGYGSVRAPAAIDLLRTGNFKEGSVSIAADAFFSVVVPPGAPSLALTLAWDDAVATPNVIPSIINDLDLEVYSPSGARAFPWTLDPNNPAALATQNKRNSIDNIEQVRVNSPAAGTWQVRIRGFTVPSGPQPFSLVSSHTLTTSAAFPSISVQAINPPTLFAPGAATPISALITPLNGSIVPGSVQLFYRNAAGPFTSVPMTTSGGDIYTASTTQFLCGANPQYYISAQVTGGPTLTDPIAGPAAPYSASVGTTTTYFSDNMEAAGAWVIGPNTATTGIWNRMDPEGTAAQPDFDTTPGAGVNCYVTNGTAGTSLTTNDVDNGSTVLTSPTFDLSTAPGSTTINYMRWFEQDVITTYTNAWLAEISNNNGANWVTLESIPAGSPVQLGWRQVSRTLSSTGLAGTNQMKIRFTANQAGTSGIYEAAIDDVVVSSVSCANPASCYVNCDASTGSPLLTANDFQCFVNAFAAADPYANCDGSTGSPALTSNDFQCFINKFAAGCP